MKNIFQPKLGLLGIGLVLATGLISSTTIAAPLRQAGEFIVIDKMTKSEKEQYIADVKSLEESFARDQAKMKNLVNKVEKNPAAYNKLTEEEKQIVDISKATSKNNGGTSSKAATNEGYTNMLPGYYYISVNGSIGGLGTGHAAIRSSQDLQTIEAYPKDGVKRYDKKWNYERKFYKAMAVGSTTSRREKAAKYAESKVGKAYNNNFLDKWNETKFYCSQLVWRAWYNQGINIDNKPNDNIVSPVEIGNSSNTYKFEYKG